MGAVDKVTSRLERHGYLLYIKTPLVSIGIRGLHVTDNPQVDVCDSYHLMINLFLCVLTFISPRVRTMVLSGPRLCQQDVPAKPSS